MPHVSVTLGMEPAMLTQIDEEARRHDMSRSEYMRHLVRQAMDSPFDEPDTVLCKDENYENGENARRNKGAA